ncbi:hypothetical protein V8C34DRAFT_274810 [Trichoderma compactum]
MSLATSRQIAWLHIPITVVAATTRIDGCSAQIRHLRPPGPGNSEQIAGAPDTVQPRLKSGGGRHSVGRVCAVSHMCMSLCRLCVGIRLSAHPTSDSLRV